MLQKKKKCTKVYISSSSSLRSAADGDGDGDGGGSFCEGRSMVDLLSID
jgi:hypothetical protein